MGNCRSVLTQEGFEAGTIVHPKDINALSTSVVSLLQDVEKRQKMGENARRRIEQDFFIQKEMAFYEKLFDSLDSTKN